MNKLFLIVSLAMTMSIANAGTLTSEGKRSDRKILEITKIVKLSNQQEQQIRTAYDAYNVKIDSALYEVRMPRLLLVSNMRQVRNLTRP